MGTLASFRVIATDVDAVIILKMLWVKWGYADRCGIYY